MPDPAPLLSFSEAVKTRRQPGGHAEAARRAAAILHLANIADRVGRKIRFIRPRTDRRRRGSQSADFAADACAVAHLSGSNIPDAAHKSQSSWGGAWGRGRGLYPDPGKPASGLCLFHSLKLFFCDAAECSPRGRTLSAGLPGLGTDPGHDHVARRIHAVGIELRRTTALGSGG